MKFQIRRTSSWDSKPIDEAYKDTYIRIDERCVDNPTKIPYYKGNKERADEDWYSEGRNHRVENGHIMRDFDDEGWFVDINSLEELIEFQKKIGREIIIGESYNNKRINCIEIYDDYRE